MCRGTTSRSTVVFCSDSAKVSGDEAHIGGDAKGEGIRADVELREVGIIGGRFRRFD
jgi:hypothetical protein